MSKIIALTLIIGGTFNVLLRVGSMDEDWDLTLTCGSRKRITAAFAILAADIARRRMDSSAALCLLGILAGCLLAACIMDLWEQYVYRFVWWAGGGAAGLLLLLRIARERPVWGTETGASLLELLLFVAIQCGIFGKMYGRADCYAFCVCAAALTALGGGFRDSLLHMTAAFAGLALVQALRKNIARNGNLRKPVPFLPYIAVSFWLWVDFMGGKWYI